MQLFSFMMPPPIFILDGCQKTVNCIYCDGNFLTPVGKNEIPQERISEEFRALCQINKNLWPIKCERCKRTMLIGARHGRKWVVLPDDFLKMVSPLRKFYNFLMSQKNLKRIATAEVIEKFNELFPEIRY